MATIVIIGCGDVGASLGIRLVADGHIVYGLRRRPELLPNAIRSLRADITTPFELQTIDGRIDYVVFAASPDDSTQPAYEKTFIDGVRHTLEAIQSHGAIRLWFVSSTSVYSQSAGEWIDESTPATPGNFRGRIILEAEQMLLDSPNHISILRAGGIYRPGALRLLESVRSGSAVSVEGPPLYTNRIHIEDVAGALRHLMNLEAPEAMYLGVDHDPCDLREVVRWLADRLGVSAPTGDSADRRHLSSKRCSNARLLSTGYQFRYPTFREGYSAIIDAMNT